jgi:hypothetical protein
MFREGSSPAGLRKVVTGRDLNDRNGARRFYAFASHGPAPVRNFIAELGSSVHQPFLDDREGVDRWLSTMNSLFRDLPTNLGATETITWITRRFIARGLQDVILTESKAHGLDIQLGVAGIVQREGRKEKPAAKGSGSTGGSGFSYSPKP